MENYDRKKIIQILSKDVFVDKLANPIEALADYLIDNGVTFKTKEIITNFDRIKSMSVEEMALAITNFKTLIIAEVVRKLGLSSKNVEHNPEKDLDMFKQWLSQEVSDE